MGRCSCCGAHTVVAWNGDLLCLTCTADRAETLIAQDEALVLFIENIVAEMFQDAHPILNGLWDGKSGG